MVKFVLILTNGCFLLIEGDVMNQVLMKVSAKRVQWLVLAIFFMLFQHTVVQAVSFHHGELKGSFDTDITYGLSVRTEDADHDNLGAYGNRHFDDAGDVFSSAIRGSSTLALDYKATGLLLRGNYFYDYQYDQVKLASDAKDKLVSEFMLTDAFVYGYFGDEEQVNIRLGQQVISWGENTFIGGSINDINTVDVNQLRQPGLALKDAFIGTQAAYIAWNINNEWMLESFYLFDFDPIELDPTGAFFATLDGAGKGGGFDHAGDGVIDAACVSPDGISCGLGTLYRAADNFAKGAQYGVALRRFFPEFLGGSEFGVYYQNLHDHVPMLSSYYGTNQFFLDYAEDIERFGLSFTANISSWAVSGEYSLRKDAPIQMTAPILNASGIDVGSCTLGGCVVGQEIRGYETVDRHQIQMTFYRIWGTSQFWGAEDSSTIIEAAYGWVDGLPHNEALDPVVTGAAKTIFASQVTDNFWGFQVQHSLVYYAAFFNVVNASPFIAFRYDVDGVSNEIAPLFLEDRKSLTLGVNFSYGNETITGGVSWTMFDGSNAMLNEGGGRLNDSTDRDFVQVNMSYSF